MTHETNQTSGENATAVVALDPGGTSEPSRQRPPAPPERDSSGGAAALYTRGRTCCACSGGVVADRRPVGSLEAEVLGVLWHRDEPLTPAKVLDELGADLAYNTILTILQRLWQKGIVGRTRVGRAHTYHPLCTEAEYAARHMQAALIKSRDRAAALHQFVDGLSSSDAAVLRDLMRQAAAK